MKIRDIDNISMITEMMNKINNQNSNIITEKYEYERNVGDKTYVVVKHKGGYLIKEKLSNGRTSFINGEVNITKYLKKTLNEARNYVNLMEDKKYVLKTDNAGSEPQPDMDMDDLLDNAGVDDMGDDEMDMGDDDMADGDDDAGEPIETDLEEYQELSGKLAYILREKSSAETVKYVLNTLIAAITVNDDNKSAVEKAIEKLTDKMNDISGGEDETDGEDEVDDEMANIDDENIKETVKRHGYIVEAKYTKAQMLQMILEKKKKKGMKNDPCWDGYEMVGFKEKNGKRVPRCVPKRK